jgi:hypothetical protein
MHSFIVFGTAAARVKVLIRLRVTAVVQPQRSVPAAGAASQCSDKMSVGWPLVSSERLNETQWLGNLWQVRVRPLSGPCEGIAFRRAQRKELTDLKKYENKECEYITICLEQSPSLRSQLSIN